MEFTILVLSKKKFLTLIPFLLDDLNGQLEHWKPSDIVWVFINPPPPELKKIIGLFELPLSRKQNHEILWVFIGPPSPELKKMS